MYNAVPSDAECIFWIAALICLAALVLVLVIRNPSAIRCDSYIEDVDAWSRNYAKIQRRY